MRAWRIAWRKASAWIAPSDEHAVLLYAEVVDDYVQLRNSLHRLGFGDAALWRLRKQLIDLAKQVNQLGGDLGLSPSARAKLGVAEVRTVEGITDLMERDKVGRPRTIYPRQG